MSVIVKSGVPGKVPTSAQLEYGQLALNYADQKMYFKNSSNLIVPYPTANIREPIVGAEGLRIVNPTGASYSTTASSVTGAIAIILPAFTSHMLSFKVNVFNYVTNGSFVLLVHGYNFGGNSWVNPSIEIISETVSQSKLIARFGVTADTKPVLYIGETNTVWNYPQVHVTDVSVGYTNSFSTIATNWTISFVTSFGTVNSTYDLTNYKFAAPVGTFFGGRNNLELVPVVSNTTNWYRIVSFNSINASCRTRFLFHWGHTTYEVTVSNGAAGDNCLLEVKLLGNYTYYDRLPSDWRLVTVGTNQPTHVDVRFPFIGATGPSFALHIIEQFTQSASQITYPGTNLGTTEASPWYGMRMSSGTAFTYGYVKIRPGAYYREAYPGFTVSTGAITNQTVVT